MAGNTDSFEDRNLTVRSRYLEKHWHPIGLEFLKRCIEVEVPTSALVLYEYMLIRSSPDKRKRVKNAHLYGETVQKGEFFENKEVVADFFGKGELCNDAKINWFLRTVKPLIRMDLVQQIESGKRGCNASYIVNDVREIIPF